MAEYGAEETIPMRVVQGGGSISTIKSEKLNFPFRLERIRAIFRLGCNDHVKVYPNIANDDSTPVVIPTSGLNPLRTLGNVEYWTGDNIARQAIVSRDYNKPPFWLKFYVDNADSFEHIIDGEFIIRRIITGDDE
jgi:hypothetical protein|tara:strand:+ start:725 stop:1129 length:405 start_codon:yes stop_codon:yes gene_type:complete